MQSPAIFGSRTTVRMPGLACRWYVVAAVVWVVRYLTLGHVPGLQTPIWVDWFDQGRYFTSATALAHGNLSPDAHWYPLSYALVAAPFVWLLPSEPFFIPDLLLFLATCEAFRRVAASGFGIAPWPATWCFLATTLVHTGLAGAWAQPWTSTLSAALIWWLIERTIAIADGRTRQGDHSLLIAGALAAALPFIRPLDVLPALTCGVVVAVALWRQRRLTGAAVLAACTGAALVCGPYAALHLAIYGPRLTGYMVAAAHTGFIPADIGWKAYVLIVNARPWFPDCTSMLEALPWMLPGCAGLIALAIVGSRRDRAVVGFLFLLILPVSLIMLTYADLQPPGLWEFCNVHYFKWTMPAFGAGVILWGRLLATAQGRIVLAATTLALLLPLGIRILPVAVAETVPARMLLFRGDTKRAWNEAYFASVRITDALGTLANVGDFHQVPDPHGQRAIAVRRLFAPHARRNDPGEPPARRSDQQPYARFGEQVSFGLP